MESAELSLEDRYLIPSYAKYSLSLERLSFRDKERTPRLGRSFLGPVDVLRLPALFSVLPHF